MALYDQFGKHRAISVYFWWIRVKNGSSWNTLHWQNCAWAITKSLSCVRARVFIILSEISLVDLIEGPAYVTIRFLAIYDHNRYRTAWNIYITAKKWPIANHISYVNSTRYKLKTLVILTKYSIVIVQSRANMSYCNEITWKTSWRQSQFA